MNNDDQKKSFITSSDDGSKKNINTDIKKDVNYIENNISSGGSSLYDDIIQDLAKRSAEHKSNNFSDNEKTDKDVVSSIHGEIEDLLNGKEEPIGNTQNKKVDDNKEKQSYSIKKNNSSNGVQTKSQIDINEGISKKDSPSIVAALSAIKNKVESTANSNLKQVNNSVNQINKTKKDSSEDIISSIKKDISEKLDLDKNESKILKEEYVGDVLDENTKKLIEKQEKKKGIGETYYSDLSSAMDSNKPETMSELLEKARFEEKEGKIISPRSKKNIIYIAGAIVLLIAIIAIIMYFFSGKKEVTYIKEERVKSLVYSDLDTGINVSNVDAEQTKQAIRKVIETKIDEGNLNQIYYAGKDQFGNLRRLGIKQVFNKTENIPPEMLYKNIENEFMHGVYKTDKNMPFIILKALSYDRAFEGMKEWEDTMIDDLATYLDLPKKAGDRSLMEDGFSDDIIKNKNVRVARFLPRDVDRRKGLWNVIDPSDIKKEDSNIPIDSQGTQEEIINNENNESSNKDNIIDETISYINNLFKNKFAYAQDTGKVRCYRTKKACFDFYGKKEDCDPNKKQSSRIVEILNKEGDWTNTFAKDYDFMLEQVKAKNWVCVDSIEGTETVGDTLDDTQPIICYKIGKQCVNENGDPVSPDYSGNKTCNDVIYNEVFDTIYGEEKYGDPDYACINSIDGSGINDDLSGRDDISCYLSHKECVDSFGNVVAYSPGDTTIICNDIIFNEPGDSVFGPEMYGEPGYSCFAENSSTLLEYNDELVESQGSWSWLLDLFFQDSIISGGGPIQPGQTLDSVNLIQNELVLLGLLDDVSISGTFDLLTQETISQFQLVNGIPKTGIIDEDTINVLKGIIAGQGNIFGGSQAAIINDYLPIGGTIGLGTYSEDVQVIQMLLFIGGFNISKIDGVFDKEVCSAVQAYQKKNNLPISSDQDCMLDAATLELFNQMISDNDYLGSGFILNGNDDLVGSGKLVGKKGPGTIGFEINNAEADSLNEGDIVLMYMFLDENTILITRSEEVITEIIKRRALNDIFNKD